MSDNNWPTPPEGDSWAPQPEHIRVEFGLVHDCALHGSEPLHEDNGIWMSLGEDPERALLRFRARGDGHFVVRTHITSSWQSLSPEQMWFWTPEHLAGEREADRQLAAGQVQVFENEQKFIEHLDSQS